jgi:hypothetical protein
VRLAQISCSRCSTMASSAKDPQQQLKSTRVTRCLSHLSVQCHAWE